MASSGKEEDTMSKKEITSRTVAQIRAKIIAEGLAGKPDMCLVENSFIGYQQYWGVVKGRRTYNG